jgi:hypothetical protein
VEKLETTPFEIGDERVAWEGLAASCAPPIRRLGAFLLIGFAYFVAVSTAVVLFYNLFGSPLVAGQGGAVPREAVYATMISSLALALGAYVVWVVRSLRSYSAFSSLLRRGGLHPRRPTAKGLRAYSDEQLLALRSRYERLPDGRRKERLGRTFGFHEGDSFALGPLSVLPGTFEMGALRVEWETNLILRSDEPMPEVSWWVEGRTGLLPRHRLRPPLHRRLGEGAQAPLRLPDRPLVRHCPRGQALRRRPGLRGLPPHPGHPQPQGPLRNRSRRGIHVR